MLHNIWLPGEVAPVQGEHVAIDINDNRVPPAIPRPFVGDDQVARRDLIPATRQSRRLGLGSRTTGPLDSGVLAFPRLPSRQALRTGLAGPAVRTRCRWRWMRLPSAPGSRPRRLGRWQMEW